MGKSAVWRILSGRNLRRQRSVGVAVPAKTNRLLRFVQSNRSIRQVRAQLAQRSNVVQNPKRAPVRADDQIIAMNGEVAHGGVGQVELQRLPVIAVIEGNKYRALRTRKKQPFALGILAHRVAGSASRNPNSNFGPGFAEVASPVNVRAQIVQAKAVDRGVRGSGVEM